MIILFLMSIIITFQAYTYLLLQFRLLLNILEIIMT